MAPSPLKCGRRQYLISYSQAEEQRFPTRECFANVVMEEFNMGDLHSKSLAGHAAVNFTRTGDSTITVQLNLLGTKNEFQ